MENLKARELRIGNYGINNQGNIFKVSWINSGIEGLLKTIPLTEDILKDNCGFKYVTMGIFKNNNFTIIKWSNECAEYHQWNANGIERKVVYIKYLHQLQNLYFELTNEELTIKL